MAGGSSMWCLDVNRKNDDDDYHDDDLRPFFLLFADYKNLSNFHSLCFASIPCFATMLIFSFVFSGCPWFSRMVGCRRINFSASIHNQLSSRNGLMPMLTITGVGCPRQPQSKRLCFKSTSIPALYFTIDAASTICFFMC